MRALRYILGLAPALMLLACFPFSAHDEVLDGPYRLVAVDTMDEMAICWTIPDGHEDCVSDVLPGEKVIAAGADDRFLVAARKVNLEPWPNPPRFATEVEYYYVIRTTDEDVRMPPPQNTVGPLTQDQFAAAKRRLSLPDFSRMFEPID